MSRTLAKKVLKRKFNTNEFGLQKSLTQILTHGNQPPEFSDDTLEYIAANIIKQMIFVSENSKTGIITINVYANEPKLSASINNAIITELDQHQKNYDKEKTVSTKRFIQDRISKTKIELESAEENLKVFTERNRRIENSPNLLLEQQRLSREVAVLTGVYTTLKQQLEITKIEELKESEYVIVLDHPEIPLAKAKPRRKTMILMSGFSGILLSVFLAFIKELFSVRSLDEKNKIKKILKICKNNLKNIFKFNFLRNK